MLTPEYLTEFTDGILALYEEFQTGVINDIARRITRMGSVTEFSVIQAEILQEAGLVYQDVMARIAELTPKSKVELERLFLEAGAKTLDYDDSVYRMAGLNPLPLNQSPKLLQQLLAGLHKTQGDLTNLTITTAITSQTTFINAASLASMQVQTGAMSYQQAIVQAIKNIAIDGAYVQYPAKKPGMPGHKDKVDVATRRAVLTGTSQTAGELQFIRMDEMGCQFVETSAHLGARPDHAVWQGRVFARFGHVAGYEDFVTVTRYGEGEGIYGWNCRHSAYPFYPGITQPNYNNDMLVAMNSETVTYDGSEMLKYDATQEQRLREREIRELKRELSALDVSISDTDDPAALRLLRTELSGASAELKQRERTLASFVKQTGLQKDTSRTQVMGFGRSVAQKAVWAAKKAT